MNTIKTNYIYTTISFIVRKEDLKNLKFLYNIISRYYLQNADNDKADVDKLIEEICKSHDHESDKYILDDQATLNSYTDIEYNDKYDIYYFTISIRSYNHIIRFFETIVNEVLDDHNIEIEAITCIEEYISTNDEIFSNSKYILRLMNIDGDTIIDKKFNSEDSIKEFINTDSRLSDFKNVEIPTITHNMRTYEDNDNGLFLVIYKYYKYDEVA